MPKLDDIIKNINKKYKANVITTDINAITFENKETIPFPSPSFTYLFHGGFPTHTLWEVSGELSSGKTVWCMAVAGQAQKYFKDKFDKEVAELSEGKPTKEQQEKLTLLLERGYKKVVWLDSEHSMYDAEWIAKCGLDFADVIYIKPQDQTAEELLQMTIDLIKSDGVGLVVIDSLATLSSKAALEKDLMDKTYAGISAALTEWTRQVLSLLNQYDCSVICINQQRDVIGAMFPTTNTPGGRAFKYGTHVRIQLRKEKAIDENYDEIPNKEETYHGQLTAVQILKNKVTKPDRRLCKFTISFNDGISAVNDTFIMALGLGIIDKGGAWYSILDEDKKPKEYNGTTLKFQGKKNFIAFMKDNPDFADELRKQVEEAVEKD